MTVLHPAGLCWLVLAVLLGYIFSSLFRLNVFFSGVALTTFMAARSGNESRSGVGWGGVGKNLLLWRRTLVRMLSLGTYKQLCKQMSISL